MAGGRPSIYTQELADTICERLALGESMRTVCASEDMPSLSTVFKWLREDEKFSQQYARAKQESADYMAEELLEIADDGTNDYMEKERPDGSTYTALDQEHIQRSRLRIDTRKFLMAKMKPKRYGDQLDVTSGGDKIVFMPTELLNKNGINPTSSTSTDSA
jgi:hypothetical protein